ncbi:ALF repeat-containing protein [Actinoplanes sp. NPDC020271]|uniref:ALF repeat-containing protein n=1 Tax=Actinoplanes sp. NPDC020271 TaxID=3363896 RepID=UPI0037B20EDE
MRGKIPAGVTLALAALLIPAAPAVARTASPSPAVTAAVTCQTVVVYKDVRALVTIDLETASDTRVRLLANQILAAATANSLTGLPSTLQQKLDGTPDELRAFLRSGVLPAWATDLRIAVLRTLANAGANAQTAAQAALDAETVDAYLTYLNHGWYVARASDAGSVVVYKDVRALVTIDLETASDTRVRLLANQILAAATANSLTGLPSTLQQKLDGTPDELRAFLRSGVLPAWATDLRIAVLRTLANAGANVQTAAQAALDAETVDAYLTYLNHGWFVARAQDCVI